MRDKIESIQFLRFFAAALVVFFHSTQAVIQYFGGGISQRIAYAADFGSSGVHIFFTISGFVMVYTSFTRRGTDFSSSEFLLRRFIRIYPIYWFYCILYILYHHYAGGDYAISANDIFGSFLLLPGYSASIIGPGWTLSYEVYFYICFGTIMALSLSRGLIVLTMFFLASVATGIVFHFKNPVLQVLTDSLLIEFLLGAGIAYLFLLGMKLPMSIAYAMQASAIAGFFGGYLIGYSHFPSLVTWGIPSAILLAGLVFNERNGHIFNWVKRCSFLGDSSYSLYLIHILLIDVFLTAYRTSGEAPSAGNVGISLSVTGLSVVVAYLLYELFERNLVVSLQFLLRRRIAYTEGTGQPTVKNCDFKRD